MNTERFYELKLDEKFEILEFGKGKEYHHKFKLKCKLCGEAHWHCDDVLRKNTKAIRCPLCGNTNYESKAKPYVKKGYPPFRVDWNTRFNESNLSNQFTFLSVDKEKRQIEMKCKNCEYIFRKSIAVWRRSKENACSCPNCKSNQFGTKGNKTIEPDFVSTIVEMYQSGKEQKEITETLNLSWCVVRYWLKEKGIYNPNRFKRGNHRFGTQQYNQQRKQESETELAFSLLEKGFGYLGGYKNVHKSEIRISCFVCGGEFVRKDVRTLLKADAIECPICLKRKKEEERKERQTVRDNRKIKELEKIFEKELDRTIFQNEKHCCKECGKEFTFKEYAEKYGFDPIFANNIEYCSRTCQRKAFNRNHPSDRHINRAKKRGCDWERGITLNRLIKRDGLQCAICGGMCDLNDKTTKDNTIICGNLYPSIDHIRPISKGGSHTWNNVQVAHRICNTNKSNKTDEKGEIVI